jgi:hypothetical protein
MKRTAGVCLSLFLLPTLGIIMSWPAGVLRSEEALPGTDAAKRSARAAIAGEPPVTAADRDHWAFQPLSRPAVPAVERTAWSRDPIDRFLLARLERAGLEPAPPADRWTWARRVTWDLTGLPPKPADVTRFVQDPWPDAHERFVDALLASADYGQRWAQPWLDLARFAETDGFEQDRIRPTAWKYRDWVIAALNADVPYDRFVRLQIAGDQLKPEDAHAAIATAFCLSGPDMTDINSMQERRHVLLNEITSTVGSVFLGLQFGCAQCHDHKFDPISQADFYRLRAFFDDSIRLQKHQSVSVLATHTDAPATHLMIRGDWRRPGPALQPAFPRLLSTHEAGPEGTRTDAERPPRSRLARWLTDRARPLTARVIVNRIWQAHFGRGLCETASDFGVMGEEPSHPRLLDYLASELIRDGWSLKRLHRRIVLSSVYRTSARRPTSAAPARRWDRAREFDPDNRLLSRFPRRRLHAEAIRDGLLAVSGSLNCAMGGPGVSPPLPIELVRTLKSGQWKVTEDPAQHVRRSVYLFARRNLRYPFFATFDRPAANQSCARRNRSTTPIQSLTLLNSRIMLQASQRLARSIGDLDLSLAEQIHELYLRLYTRRPEPDEVQAAAGFLATEATLEDLCRAMLNSNEFLYLE